jgi:hypothetical protein
LPRTWEIFEIFKNKTCGGGRGILSKHEKLNHEYLKLGVFTIQIITNMNRIGLSKMLREHNGWKFIFSNSAMDMHNGSRSIRL